MNGKQHKNQSQNFHSIRATRVTGRCSQTFLTTELLPNLNRAYVMMIQQERVRPMTRGREENGTPRSFVIKPYTVTRGESFEMTKKPLCKHCGRIVHEKDRCFQLIRYSNWWGDRPRSQGCGSGKGRGCSAGAMRDHNGYIGANAAQAGSSNAVGNGLIGEANKEGLTGVSPAQWSVLMNMLKSHRPGNKGKLTSGTKPW